MKKKLTATNVCVQALLASCALTVGLNAEAKCKSFTKCMKSGTKSITQVANSGASAVTSTVNSGTSAVNNTVNSGNSALNNTIHGGISSVTHTVNTGVSATQKAADDAAAIAALTATTLVEQGAAVTKAEMTEMLNDAKETYADGAGAVKSGYDTSVNTLKSVMDALMDGIWREAGKSFVKKNERFILDMKHRAVNLDADGKAALNRVKRAITQRDLDEQARTDMALVMKKIVYGGNNIAGAVQNSSFGIQLCSSGGVGYGGGDSCFMMIMQTYLENGVYKVGLAQSVGVAASPVPSDIGADVSYGIFWGPGGISDNAGASIGLGLGAVLEEGLEVGVSWGIPTKIPNPSSVVPGISISIGSGGKVNASLSAGYTWLAGKF